MNQNKYQPENYTAPLDEAKVNHIAQAIRQMPSPENAQPWKIVVNKDTLEIFHDSQRAKLATYPDDLSVLGLGMIAETIDLACSVTNLHAEIAYFLANRSDEHPWLTAKLSATERSPDPLAQAISLRHTDRRYYAGGTLNDPIFEDVWHEVNRMQGANLYIIDTYSPTLMQLLQDADSIVMGWDELRHDLLKWSRFTDKAYKQTRDGMPWRSYLRDSENWIYYLRSRLWWLVTYLDWFPEWLFALETYLFDDSGELSPLSYDDGAGIGCITTASDAPEDLLAAGRLILRIWLLLNFNNYGFQPLTNLASTIYPLQTGHLKLPHHVTHLMTNSYKTAQQIFGFTSPEIPIFCFRTGLAKSTYPANAKTLRRIDHIIYKKD